MNIPKLSAVPILRGAKKLCPHCGKTKLFGTGKKYWTMVPRCSNCGVVFTRETGEYIVAMYVNIFATEAIFITGYFLLDYYYDLPVLTQILIWAPFNLLFPVLFYPYSKGLWAGFLELMGALYPDK